MPWKIQEDGVIAVVDGNPVWVAESGEEKPIDHGATLRRISELNRESAGRKEELREMKARYGAFADIEDPQAWLEEAQKALEMVRNAPDKEKAVEDQIRARVDAATKPLNAKLAESQQEAEDLRRQLRREAVGNAFARSRYVKDSLVDPALAADLFSGRFQYKDGKIVAMSDDGQPVYGEEGIATFDEAIKRFVESSPYRGILIKGSAASGSGAAQSMSPSGAQVKNPWMKDSYNVTEQCRLAADNPTQAKAFMQAAGVPIPQGM